MLNKLSIYYNIIYLMYLPSWKVHTNGKLIGSSSLSIYYSSHFAKSRINLRVCVCVCVCA